MLAFVYGTNQVGIRDYILRAAKEAKAATVKEYNVDTDSLVNIEVTLQDDIFGDTALNVLDVSKASKVQLDKLLDLVSRYPSAHVVLVSTKELEPTNSLIKNVRALKGRVVLATLTRPKEVFRFLDDLFSRRAAACYKSLQKLLEIDNDPIYILVMLQYQLRNVALAKFGLSNELPPFQVTMAQQQAKNFTEKELLELYGLLSAYDIAIKTGKIVPENIVLLVTQKILMR